MRKILVLLGVALMFTACGTKEPKKEIVPEKKVETVSVPKVQKEAPKPTLVFTVQIGATKKRSAVYASIKDVQISQENGMFKYRLGAFKTYKEARLFKKTILNTYSGAFIQAVKDTKAIRIQEAIK